MQPKGRGPFARPWEPGWGEKRQLRAWLLAELVELLVVAHIRIKPIALHFHDLPQVSEVMKRPLIEEVAGTHFAHPLMNAFATQLRRTQLSQPPQVGATLPDERCQ